jgi:hypothetical protein
MQNLKITLISTLLGLFLLITFIQCNVNKVPNEVVPIKDCFTTDSLYKAMINIDFKSYQKQELRYLLEEIDLKEYKDMRFVREGSCLLYIYFRYKNNLGVKIELSSFKKLKRCVAEYSEWQLEDAKYESFDKVTIFNSCDTKNFQHFIYDANAVKKDGN